MHQQLSNPLIYLNFILNRFQKKKSCCSCILLFLIILLKEIEIPKLPFSILNRILSSCFSKQEITLILLTKSWCSMESIEVPFVNVPLLYIIFHSRNPSLFGDTNKVIKQIKIQKSCMENFYDIHLETDMKCKKGYYIL